MFDAFWRRFADETGTKMTLKQFHSIINLDRLARDAARKLVGLTSHEYTGNTHTSMHVTTKGSRTSPAPLSCTQNFAQFKACDPDHSGGVTIQELRGALDPCPRPNILLVHSHESYQKPLRSSRHWRLHSDCCPPETPHSTC